MRFHTSLVAVVGACAALAGCGGLTDATGRTPLPSGFVDPSTYRTPDGALGMYRRTVLQFERAFLDALLAGGELSDELRAANEVDQRVLPERVPHTVTDGAYEALQRVRTYRVQATGALAKYAPDAPAALRGHAFALAGYAEVLLADLFCSGVPLSELEFEGDFVYKDGSSTAQVYRHAITLFDSALALSVDSARILNLARVGKGRALLALGEFDAAARAVAAVPPTYRDTFPTIWTTDNERRDEGMISLLLAFASVSDREGGTGLPYRTDGDPRTAAQDVTLSFATGARIHAFPVKYGTPVAVTNQYGAWSDASVTSPVVVASGVEARLIRAEAALRAGQVTEWASALNDLRATAITPALPPLPADSTAGASAALRVRVMFAERAKWLFVDGHRQGDLRRLLRQYPQDYPSQGYAYPSGPYIPLDAPTAGLPTYYGSDVTAPVPTSEDPNPRFSGCFSRLP